MNNIKTKKRKKKSVDEQFRRGFKRASGFSFSLFVNLVIAFFIVKAFSYSFNFAYSVFSDSALNPASQEYKVVEVPADSSVLDIGEALEESGIIKDKYVFFAKVRVKGYGDKIVSGKYGLCASMKYEDIMNTICHIEDTDEEEE